MSDNKPNLIVYVSTAKDDKSYYDRVGAAWKHKKGEGMSISLTALPIDGKLVLFPPTNRPETLPVKTE